MRIQPLLFALLISTSSLGPVSVAANAEGAEHLAAALSELAETPVRNYTLVFDHPEAVLSERRPIGSALTLIADFLAKKEFPAPRALPRVEFASSAQIAAVRYRDLISEPELMSFSFSNDANALDMVYDDAQGVLHLSEFWSGGSPAEFSVLVHGLVNHAQREAGLVYACTQEREQVAYAARDAWLRLFGQTVQATLGFDEAAYMLSTQCIP
jgi:hypothetical protein